MDTLVKLEACDPAPAEILVHVDGGDTLTAVEILKRFPGIQVLKSSRRLGPGGGRQRLIEVARHPVVVSLDDDSYPLDRDFFGRVIRLFEIFPEAAVIGAAIYHRNESQNDATESFAPATSFPGGGAALRRDAFLEAGGYVPLPTAYSMEEVDLALRLCDRGVQILYSPWLRVYHDTDLSHHESSEVTAATLRNIALHAFLRYPLMQLPYGMLQVANRVLWSLRAGRIVGLLSGLAGTPNELWRYRAWRAPVSARTISWVRRQRRLPAPQLRPLPANSLEGVRAGVGGDA